MQESQLLLDRKRFTAVYRNVMRSFLVQISYYRPPSKLRKGNVFSHACLYVHRAGPHMTTTWTCLNLFTWGRPRALALALLTPHTGTPPPGTSCKVGVGLWLKRLLDSLMFGSVRHISKKIWWFFLAIMIVIMIVAADSIRLKWIWRRLTIADKVVKSIKDDKETKKMYADNKVNKFETWLLKLVRKHFDGAVLVHRVISTLHGYFCKNFCEKGTHLC